MKGIVQTINESLITEKRDAKIRIDKKNGLVDDKKNIIDKSKYLVMKSKMGGVVQMKFKGYDESTDLYHFEPTDNEWKGSLTIEISEKEVKEWYADETKNGNKYAKLFVIIDENGKYIEPETVCLRK